MYVYMYNNTSVWTKMFNCNYNAFQAVSIHQSNWFNLLVCVAVSLMTSTHGQLGIHDDHYYVMNDYRMRWEAAAAACRNDSGYLVSINTQEEQAFVHDFYRDNTASTTHFLWIGLKCELQTRCAGAQWEDGTAVSYTAWWGTNRKYTLLYTIVRDSTR